MMEKNEGIIQKGRLFSMNHFLRSLKYTFSTEYLRFALILSIIFRFRYRIEDLFPLLSSKVTLIEHFSKFFSGKKRKIIHCLTFLNLVFVNNYALIYFHYLKIFKNFALIY